MGDDVNWELVLHRLDELSKSQVTLNSHMETLEDKITHIGMVVESIQDIKTWKSGMEDAISTSELRDMKVWRKRIDEVISPTQLKTIVDEVESLKTFKTQAMMIWVVVQDIMAILIFMKDFM